MLELDLKTVTDFCKRKGFVYQGSQIYGGLANTWDYGPKGVLLKDNLKKAWKTHFVTERMDMVELDAGLLMNQKVWETSGHTAGFADCLIDDKTTKHRFRVDHLIEAQHDIDVEGWSAEKITDFVREKGLINPNTNKPGDWTDARYMNLMFETNRDKLSNAISIIEDLLSKVEGDKINLGSQDIENLKTKLEAQTQGRIYLRPETAQGIFVNFKNVMATERKKLPFGIAQIGKAFRNEITPGNFVFRIIELEQMEIEYFFNPPTTDQDWNQPFEEMLELQRTFFTNKVGLKSDNLKLKEHSPEKLSHYSKRTADFEYRFPFGFSELSGNAYRTDFDLKIHQEASGVDLTYLDPVTNTKFLPHVIEPSIGLDRLFLATICEHYRAEVLEEGDTRIVLGLPNNLAPYKYAVLPLMKKDGLAEKAKDLFFELKKAGLSTDYDDAGSIGKRYRRQDENGTPACICVDYQTLEDGTVTLRDRDTMEQTRIAISDLILK
jgi:glycyl-tRNA synthetase